MATQRADGKTQLGVWLTPEERVILKERLATDGHRTFADMARAYIEGTPTTPISKTIGLEALGELVIAKVNSTPGAREYLAALLKLKEETA